MPTAAQLRQTMVDKGNWAIQHRSGFTCEQVRPIKFPPPRTLPMKTVRGAGVVPGCPITVLELIPG